MTDQIIAFRIDTAQYDRLRAYANDNGMTMSEVIRRAVKWMLLLYNDERRRR